MPQTVRRKLLVVLHDELLNGASIAVLRLSEPLEELGWDISFWVPQPGPAFDWLVERGHRVDGRPRPVASGLKALRQPPGVTRRIAATPSYLGAFKSFARRTSPDVVHANSLYSFAEALVCRAVGLPTLMHLHDMAPRSWKAEPVRQMTRRLMSGCVAVSQSCADSYETGGWKPSVVFGAVPVPQSPNQVREDPTPFVVGTVGVISHRKGSDLFVEAAERLRANYPNIEMRMIGSATDPLDRGWGEGVIERALRAGIKYVAHADVAEELKDWDAFVLPSRRDPFPLVVLEAMAAGLPSIGTRVDGIEEQLSPGAGFLVPPGDADALATEIAKLAKLEREERAAIARAARSRVQDRFSLDRQAAEMDAAYRAVHAGRP